MQNLLLGESMDSELDRLHTACQEWGFFLLPGDLEGFGQAFVTSEEQILDWGDMFYIVTLPTVLRKPHIFPKLHVSFRETIEAYSSELQRVAMTLLGLMARALEMDNEEMRELFEDGYQGMRMNYYPPCPQPELVNGLTPHSDVVGLTLLLQINEMEGLQIRKQGDWIPVNPLPNAFIVNIGDALEILSNRVYRSIEQRATVNSVKERLSVATFYSPSIDSEVGPAQSLINPKNPALFKRVGTKEYFKGFFAQKLQGKSYLETLRIEIGEKNVA